MPAPETLSPFWTRISRGFSLALLLQSFGLAGAWAGAPGRNYVGDDACAECHQEKTATYHRTAHALTSSLPSPASIGGSFEAGRNILTTANPDLHFELEANEKGFFQTAKIKLPDTRTLFRSERIDVVIGSGRKGQTYLFWDGDQLFELPVSYWTEGGKWVNSPSYPDGTASFERPVFPRCLECHVSNFTSRAPPINSFQPASLAMGLACEKCHGPGSEHIALYRATPHPTATVASAIVNPAKLPRERQIEICALCHDGIGTSLTPPLSFVPGDNLAKHLVFESTKPEAHIDAHSGQVQLLARSKCYQSSPAMTCATCHDVHQPQRDFAALAARCLTCHQVNQCRKFPALGHRIDQQCITCHMPAEVTEQIISSANGRSMQPKVRSHRIAVYPGIELP